MGVWMKMILQTLSLSTSSAIKESCLSCRDIMYFTRSLVDFYTAGQRIIWNVGLLLPHYMVSLPPWSAYSQRITVYSLLIIYDHHKAICLFVHKSALRLFQNTINRKLQDSDHSGITAVLNLGTSQLNGKANVLGRMSSLVRGKNLPLLACLKAHTTNFGPIRRIAKSDC